CGTVLQSIQDDTLITLLRKGVALRGEAKVAPRPKENETYTAALPQSEGAELSAAPAVVPKALHEHPRYRVVRLLGKGGMGDVYLALHQHLGKQVALKVIKASLLEDATAVQRFRQEIRAVGQLSHPHIVQAHDADQAGDLHFLVMEYVEGKSLAEYAQQQG